MTPSSQPPTEINRPPAAATTRVTAAASAPATTTPTGLAGSAVGRISATPRPTVPNRTSTAAGRTAATFLIMIKATESAVGGTLRYAQRPLKGTLIGAHLGGGAGSAQHDDGKADQDDGT